MIDLEDVIKRIRSSKPSFLEMEEKLKMLQASAESGGGLVKATVDGGKDLYSIQIDDSLLNPESKTMLQDLIVAAVNLALEKIESQVEEGLKEAIGLQDKF